MTMNKVLKDNKRRFNSNIRGSLVIEVTVSLVLLIFVMGVNLELVRRAFYETVFQQGVFLYVRDRALGFSYLAARKRVKVFFDRAFPLALSSQINQKIKITDNDSSEGIEGRFYLRYPSFFKFINSDGQMKHHFEVTKKCHFPS